MKFNNLKIGTRLGAAFAGILLICALVGLFAISRLSVVNDATKDVATNWLVATRQLGEYRASINIMRRAEAQHMMSLSGDEFTKWEKKIEEAKGKAAEAWGKYEATVTTPEERVLADEIKAAEKRYFGVQPTLLKTSRATDGVTNELRQIFNGESLESLNTLLAAVQKDVEFQSSGSDAAYAGSQAVFSQTRAAVIGLLLAAIGIGAALAWFITRSITRPVAQALKVAETVAGGDLTSNVHVESTDEIGQMLQALGKMNTNLSDIVLKVRNSSDSIATGSQQIATGNADLSQRTEEQASNLQQTAASMEQLTATVQQNTESASQASQLAIQASTVAQRGGQMVGEVVTTMDAISQSSRKISDIISVIDGIAFQTNILALNAAVEAARAGEQGRGFAVVAGEVRTLAQRSAQAAKEIKSLIGESVEKVQAGTNLVSNAGKTMDEIVAAVMRVSDLVGEISAASREQNEGIGQVGDAVQQLDQVTQQNAALVEESAAASDSLQQQARQLAEIVSFFHLGQDAQSTVRPSVKASATAKPTALAPVRHPVAAKVTSAPKKAAAKPVRAGTDAKHAAVAKAAEPTSAKVNEEESAEWETF